MKTSDQIDLLAAALLKAQGAIQAVVKDKTGKVQSKSGASYEYKYSDLASVIEHVKPHLNAAGILFTQGAAGDSAGVVVETRLIHTSGQWIATTVFLPVNSGTAQAYGSAITYGKRYGLQALTGLPSEDDDGKAASEAAPAKPNGKDVAIPANIEGKELFELMSPDEKDYYSSHARALEKLTPEAADAYIEREKFDHDERLVLWHLLPSNVRNPIKKAADARRAKDLATQP